jgi:hypothetical protein
MTKISQKELKRIQRMVAREFPNDPALQQVHIARKIIAHEAELRGMTFPEYIISLRRPAQHSRRRHAG